MQSLTYMPLLRGRQIELRLLQIAAPLIQEAQVIAVVEPVSANTAMLEDVIAYYANFQIPLAVVVNPAVGDFSKSSQQLMLRIGDLLHRTSQVFPATRTSVDGIAWSRLESAEKFALIGDGPPCGEVRLKLLSDPSRIKYHIVESEVERPEQPLGKQVLLRDGFTRRRNVDYPPDEKFLAGPGRMDLHGASGWGDYLIVGQEYRAGGGRPHAVAIHITYWAFDGGLRVHHYLSDSNDGPEDPAGKFAEAVGKLVADLDQGTYPVRETSAIGRLRELHERAHFPGLGYLKLLAMWHHLETVIHRSSIGG